jgi:hypothetical protein
MPYHTELVKLPWKGIITTNYDEFLEDALKQIDRKYIKVTLDRNVDLTERPARRQAGPGGSGEGTGCAGEGYT